MKNTLVIGASTNVERYSNMAIKLLNANNHLVFAIGNKAGEVDGVNIYTNNNPFNNIDTVTLYIGAKHQPEYYNYILSLKPNRIIFNPGTENEELENLAKANNIVTSEACTLVLIKTGQY